MPKGWCGVPLRLALLIAVGAGCRATPVAICEWPADHFSGSQSVLLDEVRLAEDIAIRYADGGGYQTGWRHRRESCEATLFATLAEARNVGIAQVEAVRGQLDSRGFDWLVNIPVGFVCVLLALVTTRRIRDRFAGEAIARLVAIAIVSIGISIAIVAIGQLWASAVETIRIGNGHLSYRASRIPWLHHRIETFTLAVIVTWVLALTQWRGTGRSYRHPRANL